MFRKHEMKIGIENHQEYDNQCQAIKKMYEALG